MPYNSYYSRTRPRAFNRRYKRRPRPTRMQIYGGAGRQLWKDVRKLKSLINVEFKQHTVKLTAEAIGITTDFNNLCLINQGDTDETRDGSSIRLKSIDLKGFVKLHASATSTMIRIIIVLDKQTNQAQFTYPDLYEDATTGDAIISARNIDNAHRFVVLMDTRISLSASGNSVVPFSFYKKINTIIRYDNTGNVVADLTSNAYSLLLVSDEATNTPAVTLSARLRYIDN